MCAKSIFQVELSRGERDHDLGISVEAELAEDAEQEDQLCVFVSEIVKGGVAFRKGTVSIFTMLLRCWYKIV